MTILATCTWTINLCSDLFSSMFNAMRLFIFNNLFVQLSCDFLNFIIRYKLYLGTLLPIILFIFSMQCLSSHSKAVFGNVLAMFAMSIAVIVAMIASSGFSLFIVTAIAIGAVTGLLIALRINMQTLPQLMAGFHSLIGLAAVIVDIVFFLQYQAICYESPQLLPFIEMSCGILVGMITFTGSLVALYKIQGKLQANWPFMKYSNVILFLVSITTMYTLRNFCVEQSICAMRQFIISAGFLGVWLILPVSGANMAIMVSVLNACSGAAAVAIGISTGSYLLVTIGMIVAASGSILSYLMCKSMNKSLLSVLFAKITTGAKHTNNDRAAQVASPADVAFILSNASSVIIIPGYGMAAAQAQHAVKAISDKLFARGINVVYGIHPVAGRMPGHMNVLLAEANVEHDDMKEIDDINIQLAHTDVVLVVGANDTINPLAKTDDTSEIYGMEVFDIEKAQRVFIIKRSMGQGYASIDNPAFYANNTMMVLGNAKKVCEDICKVL
jgi:NAD(P) transhydrogenase subunit beta